MLIGWELKKKKEEPEETVCPTQHTLICLLTHSLKTNVLIANYVPSTLLCTRAEKR